MALTLVRKPDKMGTSGFRDYKGDRKMTIALEQSIVELVGYIKELCPDARLRITGRRFEDEDANIDIYPPLDWSLNQLGVFQLS
jgi:hypothetical protein